MPTLTKYILGYGFSLLITLTAFGLVFAHIASGHIYPSHHVLYPVLIALALLQLVVQLILFLHVGVEEKPRWNLAALSFALIIVTILVGGTLWIMHNLAIGHEATMTTTEPFIGNQITPQAEND